VSYITVSLKPDIEEIATVRPSLVSGRCPGSWEIKVCAGHEVGHTIINALPDTFSEKNLYD
jgi:hypothetical protein